MIAFALVAVDSRRDVDEDETADELGTPLGERDRRQPAERHPDDRRGVGCQCGDRLGDVDGERLGSVRRARGADAVGMPVAGKVEGDERSVEGEGDGVPGVGVLGATVEQHELR